MIDGSSEDFIVMPSDTPDNQSSLPEGVINAVFYSVKVLIKCFFLLGY